MSLRERSSTITTAAAGGAPPFDGNVAEGLQRGPTRVEHQMVVFRPQNPRSRIVPRAGWYSLPFEIRSAILRLCVPNDDVEYHSSTPLALCLVSRAWREDTVDTPDVWSKIVLRGLSWPAFSFAVSRGALWSVRSHPRPLVINIALPYGDKSMSASGGRDAMMFMAGQLHRCERLTITVTEGFPIPDALAHLQGKAPLLSSFSLLLEEWAVESVIEGAQSAADTLFAGCTPQLTSATVPSFGIRWPMSFLYNLTTLHVTDRATIPLRQILNLFELTLPHLTTLDLCFVLAVADDSAVFLPIVTNASVTHLTLEGQSFSEAIRVLDQLNLPKVHDLAINGNEPFTSLVPVSTSTIPFPEIYRFSVGDEIQGPPDLRPLLERMDSLRTVEISDLETLELFINEIGHDERGKLNVLCPHLVELTCRSDAEEALRNWRDYVRDLTWLLITRRDANCATMQQLTIPRLGLMHEKIEKALKKIAPDLVIVVRSDLHDNKRYY